MPRLHFVKSARKDNDRCGVKAGESYYWWQNRGSGGKGAGIKRCSKTRPKPSQMTLSDFYQAVYALQEDIMENAGQIDNVDDLRSMRDDWAEQARQIGQDQNEKLTNMPEGLQQGPTGELLQERADACETWGDEIEAVEIPDPEDFAEEEEPEAALTQAIEDAIYEMANLSPEV